MGTLRVSRGDTLTLTGTRTDAAGNAVSLVGTTVACEMVRGGTRLTLDCTVTDAAAGQWQATRTAAEMADVALGLWRSDVQFTSDAGVTSTETFSIEVAEDITGAGSS